MRKLLRKIAHYNMSKMGIEKINKPSFNKTGRLPSKFALHWREYAH